MPKVVDREQKRAELLDGAVDAIAKRGLDGVKLMDIAAEAGVTTGAIGYYFRDKDELLVATLEHLWRQVLVDGGAEAMTFFHGDLGLFLPTTERARTFWRVWLAYCGAAPSSPALLTAYRRFYEAIETQIADHLRERGTADPVDLAGAIVAAVDGIGLCATVAPDLWPDDRQTTTLRTIVEALFADHGSGGHDLGTDPRSHPHQPTTEPTGSM
ncbi:MAG: TetR/AcrR family transcriptional regulator [Actinomycetota bacterium]